MTERPAHEQTAKQTAAIAAEVADIDAAHEQAATDAAAVADIDAAHEQAATDAAAVAAIDAAHEQAATDAAIDAAHEQAATDIAAASAAAWNEARDAVDVARYILQDAIKTVTDTCDSIKVCERTVYTMHAEVIAACNEYDALRMSADESLLDVARVKHEDLCDALMAALEDLDHANSAFNEAVEYCEVATEVLNTATTAKCSLRTWCG
jgi:Zn-dependent M32 family carboxypeptidase